MSEQNPVVLMETSMGNITIELNMENAPLTSENFLTYVNEGFYNNTIFHRVIQNFMIQGGGLTADMRTKPTNETIKNEADNGLKNDKYAIAMARTQEPHSASSQFFINTKNNDFLNFKAKNINGWGYCVFGKVIDGTETVDKIETVATGNKAGHGDVPVETITINKVTVQ